MNDLFNEKWKSYWGGGRCLGVVIWVICSGGRCLGVVIWVVCSGDHQGWGVERNLILVYIQMIISYNGTIVIKDNFSTKYFSKFYQFLKKFRFFFLKRPGKYKFLIKR